MHPHFGWRMTIIGLPYSTVHCNKIKEKGKGPDIYLLAAVALFFLCRIAKKREMGIIEREREKERGRIQYNTSLLISLLDTDYCT
jgi:hypothetical protein